MCHTGFAIDEKEHRHARGQQNIVDKYKQNIGDNNLCQSDLRGVKGSTGQPYSSKSKALKRKSLFNFAKVPHKIPPLISDPGPLYISHCEPLLPLTLSLNMTWEAPIRRGEMDPFGSAMKLRSIICNTSNAEMAGEHVHGLAP